MTAQYRLYWVLATALFFLSAVTRPAMGIDLGQQAVDPALVGTWRLSSENQNGAVMFVWVIGNDGHYRLTSQGPHNKKDETGQLSFANGNWNLQSDAGRTDGGTYQARDPNTLAVIGKGGTGIWFRARDAQTAASEGNAPAATGPVDSQIVGTWRWEVPSPDGPVVITWAIDANGQYRLNSQGSGQAVHDTGQVTFAQGSWSKQSDTGKANQGAYNLIDQDTLSVTGSAGRTATWLRLVNATPATPPQAASPVAPARPR